MNKRERISQWLADATGKEANPDQAEVEKHPYYRAFFHCWNEQQDRRSARCFGTALAQHQIARRRFLQGIDPGCGRVRSSAKALRTSVARQAQQTLASGGAFVSAGAEKSREVRAMASRAGRCSALPAFEPIRRRDRRVGLHNQSLVTANRAKAGVDIVFGPRVLPSAFTLASAIKSKERRSGRPSMCDGWEAVTPWVYLVKINLIPAIISTVARQREITRTAKRLLPRCEPIMPPTIAAAARMNPSEGMVRTFVK